MERSQRLAWLVGLLLFAACSGNDEAIEDLGETIAVDLDQLFETIEETAAAVADLDATETTTDEECWESTGDCEACSAYEGTSAQGAFGVTMTETPCGETWETNARTRTYTVEDTSLEGSWLAREGTTYDWTIEGSQRVEYVVDGPRPSDRVYDASWELDELVAETLDGQLGEYEIAATYSGYADLTTRLDISGTADEGEGTVILEDDDNDQVICTFSRDGELVTIVCD